MIPNKVDVINGEWLGAYNHFRERLNERYGLDVSIREYILICQKPLIDQVKESSNLQIGYVFVGGRKVLAVRDRRYKRLRTALPFK